MNYEKRDGFFKTLFVVIGAVVSLCAVIALAYVLFKKYFQVTFDCEGDGGIADGDNPFADEEDEAFEPICCCDEEDAGEASDEGETCCCDGGEKADAEAEPDAE